MKVNLESIKGTEKKVDVYIPVEKVKEKNSEVFREFKKNAKIKGFRPGKAPDSVIRSMYGESIREEIVSGLVSDSLHNALEQVSVTPINKPRIDADDIKPDSEFHYSAVFEVLPEFELSQYKGLELTKRKTEVKEEDVEKTLEQIRERSAQTKLPEEPRPVAKGDNVVVDFEGTIDGEVVPDLKRENVQFIAGEGQLIEEFDKNLIGMNRGDESEFDVNYDENFQIEEAAGKTVHYRLKVNEIYERVFPEINDEFAKEIGYDTLDELKRKIKEDLQNQYEREEQGRVTQEILDKLNSSHDIEIPESLLNQEIDRLKRDYAANLQRQGIQMPPIDQEMEEKFRVRAENNVKSSIILSEIARTEEIKVTSQEIEQRLKHIADSLQMPYENVRQVYVENNMLPNLEGSITEEKVLDFIKESAKFTEPEGEDNLVDNKNQS